MNEPMPAHDERRYSRWAHKRRESLASKASRVRAALTFQPQTATDISAQIGMPACEVADVLRRLKHEGRARFSGKTTLPDGRSVMSFTTADAPTVADLISVHVGNPLCRRFA